MLLILSYVPALPPIATPNMPLPPPPEFDQELQSLVDDEHQFNVITMCLEWFQCENGIMEAQSSPATDKIDIVIDEPEQVKGHFKRVHVVSPTL